MRLLLPCLSLAILISTTTAVRAADPLPCSPDLSGHWVGCWKSDKNGHRGPLRATFTKVSDSCYRVRFFGRFFKVIPFTYAVNLTVTATHGDHVTLAGSLLLGPVLGAFHTSAVATESSFRAQFTSKGDQGQFLLNRPK